MYASLVKLKNKNKNLYTYLFIYCIVIPIIDFVLKYYMWNRDPSNERIAWFSVI